MTNVDDAENGNLEELPRIINALKDIATRAAAAKNTDEKDRIALREAAEGLRHQFSLLDAWLARELNDAKGRQGYYRVISDLLFFAFDIGARAAIPSSLLRYAAERQAAKARAAGAAKLRPQQDALRAAILAVTENDVLVDGEKFADSIRDKVNAQVAKHGGKPRSTRTIRRTIKAILQERAKT